MYYVAAPRVAFRDSLGEFVDGLVYYVAAPRLAFRGSLGEFVDGLVCYVVVLVPLSQGYRDVVVWRLHCVPVLLGA